MKRIKTFNTKLLSKVINRKKKRRKKFRLLNHVNNPTKRTITTTFINAITISLIFNFLLKKKERKTLKIWK